ncbi:hypothetical protein Trydic_g19413 [Trypoxylus dichotomus]
MIVLLCEVIMTLLRAFLRIEKGRVYSAVVLERKRRSPVGEKRTADGDEKSVVGFDRKRGQWYGALCWLLLFCFGKLEVNRFPRFCDGMREGSDYRVRPAPATTNTC